MQIIHQQTELSDDHYDVFMMRSALRSFLSRAEDKGCTQAVLSAERKGLNTVVRMTTDIGFYEATIGIQGRVIDKRMVLV